MKGKYKQCLSNTSHSPECVSHNRRYLPAAIQDNLPTSEDNYAMHSSAAIKYHPPRIIICNYALQLWSAVNVMNWNARCRIKAQFSYCQKTGLFFFIFWRNLVLFNLLKKSCLLCVSKWVLSISNVCKSTPLCLQEKNNTIVRGNIIFTFTTI